MFSTASGWSWPALALGIKISILLDTKSIPVVLFLPQKKTKAKRNNYATECTVIIENKTFFTQQRKHISQQFSHSFWKDMNHIASVLDSNVNFPSVPAFEAHFQFFGVHAEELICHGNNLNLWRAGCCDVQMKKESWFTRMPICSNCLHCVIIPREVLEIASPQGANETQRWWVFLWSYFLSSSETL